MTITDETNRDIVRFIKGFPLNSWFDDVTYISSLYGETEEDSTGSLSVEMKKKQSNSLFAVLCKNV